MPTETEIVECFYCGCPAELDEGGRYVRHGGDPPCQYSGARHDHHKARFRITGWTEEDRPIAWRADCLCGEVYTGPTHESVESPWRAHLAEQRAQVS